MNEENVDLKNVRAEVADVKAAIVRRIDNLATEVVGEIRGVGGKIDGQADALLARVARSRYSWLYIVGALASAFALGALIF